MATVEEKREHERQLAEVNAFELIALGRVAAELMDKVAFQSSMVKRYEDDGDTYLAAVAAKMLHMYLSLWELADEALRAKRMVLRFPTSQDNN